MSGEARLVCAKCGADATGLACGECGGAIVKICPRCEFKNSPAKGFCDTCGTELKTAAGTALPQAGRVAAMPDASAAVAGPARAGADDEEAPPPRRRASLGQLLQAAFTMLFLIVLGGAGGLFYLNARHEQSPRVLVPKLAAQYLNALQAQDWTTAYGMLSDDSRADFTLNEFAALRDTTPWTWANLTISIVEPDAVALQYDLSVKGRPTIRDTVLFAYQNDRWARPYNWPELKRAEDEFARDNADLALMKAGEAVRIDPRDPMARGYLCESVYYLGLASKVEGECRAALDLAQRYPSKLTSKSLYHLHSILAETYKTHLRQPGKAADEYSAMLAFPDVAAQDKCDLLLARADAYAASARVADGLADLESARGVCTRRDDLDYARKRLKALNPR